MLSSIVWQFSKIRILLCVPWQLFIWPNPSLRRLLSTLTCCSTTAFFSLRMLQVFVSIWPCLVSLLFADKVGRHENDLFGASGPKRVDRTIHSDFRTSLLYQPKVGRHGTIRISLLTLSQSVKVMNTKWSTFYCLVFIKVLRCMQRASKT